MIEPGSLIGFFLVFVACAWAGGALASLALSLAQQPLRRNGPAAEKRAAWLAITGPVALAAVIAIGLAAISALPALSGSTDHCSGHGHHPHLCLLHGAGWAQQAWAVIATAGLVALFAVRLLRLAITLVMARLRIRLIQESSRRIGDGPFPVYLAPSQRDFCFVTGLRRPRVLVASSLWERLGEAQRAAVLGHERVHVERRDLWQALGLSLCGVLAPPLMWRRCMVRWGSATERLCDRLAANRVGDATHVADALLAWARGPHPVAGLAFLPDGDHLEERIVAVIGDSPVGDGLAARIARSAAVAALIALGMTLVLADPVHHALESLFGLL